MQGENDIGEGHNTRSAVTIKSTGTVHMLMVFVDFSDAPANKAPAGIPRDTEDYYRPMVTRATTFLSQASHGRLTLDVDKVSGWTRLPAPAESYRVGDDTSGDGVDAANAKVFSDLARVLPARVKLAKYDGVYVVPIASATRWARARLFASGNVKESGGVVSGVLFDVNSRGNLDPREQLMAHETGHLFGLPDLYMEGATGDDYLPTGSIDLMGFDAGAAPTLLAWHQWKLGWIDDSQVRCLKRGSTTNVTLTPVEKGGKGLRAAVVHTGAHRALVVESRRAIGLDKRLCAPGVLTYTVNTSTESGDGPVNTVHVDSKPSPRSECTPADMSTLRDGSTRTLRDRKDGVTVTLKRQGADFDAVTITVDPRPGAAKK